MKFSRYMIGMAAWLLPLAVVGETLQARIDRAEAGATVLLPPGVHRGGIVITKPLRLIGARGAEIEGSGSGHVIDVRAADVEIRGLLIRKSGSDLSGDDAGIHVRAPRATIHDNVIVDTLHGIYLRKAPEARITGNSIRGRAAAAAIGDPVVLGVALAAADMCSVELPQDQRGNGIHIWYSSGHYIADNDIRGTRDGIYFQFCDRTTIRGNTISDVRYGLHYMYSHDNTFEQNTFVRNAAGSALMYSNRIVLRENRFVANRSHRAYGLLLHTVEQTRIEDNEFSANTVGIFVENSVGNRFRGNRITGNYIGLRLSDSSDGNVFTENRFAGNVHAAESSGLRQENAFSEGGRGNYWEGAVKVDLNTDGVSDVPHQEVDVFGRWRRAFPEIGLLSGSPGERALHVAHARVRVPGLPAITDPRPLTTWSKQ